MIALFLAIDFSRFLKLSAQMESLIENLTFVCLAVCTCPCLHTSCFSWPDHVDRRHQHAWRVQQIPRWEGRNSGIRCVVSTWVCTAMMALEQSWKSMMHRRPQRRCHPPLCQQPALDTVAPAPTLVRRDFQMVKTRAAGRFGLLLPSSRWPIYRRGFNGAARLPQVPFLQVWKPERAASHSVMGNAQAFVNQTMVRTHWDVSDTLLFGLSDNLSSVYSISEYPCANNQLQVSYLNFS